MIVCVEMLGWLLRAALFYAATAQRLYGEHLSIEEHMAPSYPGERCAFYDVWRLSWRAVRSVTTGKRLVENDVRRWPRLGELLARPATQPNLTVCDGYGVTRGHVRVPCARECPANPFAQPSWSVLLCAPRPLVPLAPPMGSAGAGAINLLLVGSEHNNHGLFAQLERVLNQLHLAEHLGLPPYVFLGRKVAAPPMSCGVGENQYFDARRGANVWEYYFEQLSSYSLGAPTLRGRPVRLLLTDPDDARRHAIRVSRDAVTSYFEFKRYDDKLHEIRTRVRQMGARLVRRWVRVQPAIRADAAERLVAWRRRSSSLLGVHLRGTDKVTHPKIPLERFFGAVDGYVRAHPDALIVLATDDRRYHQRMLARYGARVVSASEGYETANVVRDPSLDRYGKGRSALVDALLLAHCDFLLKGTSSLSEFALWYNPALIPRHLDLQIEGEGAASPAYRRLVPSWAGGAYEPPPLPAEATAGAMLERLRQGTRLDSAAPAEASTAAGAVAVPPPTARPAAMPPVAARLEADALRGGGGRGRRRRHGKGGGATPRRRRQLGGEEADGEEDGGAARRGGGGGGGGGGGSAAVAVVPVWPLPGPQLTEANNPRAAPPENVAHTAINSGTCAARGLRLLGADECELLASLLPSHKFIGRTREPSEFPGCVRWGGGYVEFNDHADQRPGCKVGGDSSGPPPACLCSAARAP